MKKYLYFFALLLLVLCSCQTETPHADFDYAIIRYSFEAGTNLNKVLDVELTLTDWNGNVVSTENIFASSTKYSGETERLWAEAAPGTYTLSLKGKARLDFDNSNAVQALLNAYSITCYSYGVDGHPFLTEQPKEYTCGGIISTSSGFNLAAVHDMAGVFNELNKYKWTIEVQRNGKIKITSVSNK